jgi:O-antigen/teichoic acid export membrane protein
MSQGARRILQNSLIRVGGYAVGSVLYLAIIVLVGRHLGAEVFGHFSFVLAVVGSVQLAVDMGVRSILIRDIAVDRTSRAGSARGARCSGSSPRSRSG